MLKSEGILCFLKKILLMRKKSHPLDIFSHRINVTFRNKTSFCFSKHNLMMAQLIFFHFFWPCVAWKAQIPPLCCRCTTGNSWVPRSGVSSLPERHMQDVTVSPVHWTKPIPIQLNNRSPHCPIWQSAPFMLLRTPTLAQLSWTYALLRLISSMK